MRRRRFVLMTILALAFVPQSRVFAGVISFGSGANAFSMEFVEIGDPGNAADTMGKPVAAGSVGYTYSMGVHEVSRDMVTKANAAGGLGITLGGTFDGGPRGDMAATGISWFEAARFVNYLNTSQGFAEAYKFDSNGNFQLWLSGDAGYDASNTTRNSLANFVLPTTDEWYKSAFYDGNGGYFDFATGSNSIPMAVASGTAADTAVWQQSLEQGPADITKAGGLSALGTMGQSGNVYEWEESYLDPGNGPLRGFRGGNWSVNPGFSGNLSSSHRSGTDPSKESISYGFRVASLGTNVVVPEPSSFAILLTCGITAGLCRKRHPSKR